MSGPFLAQISIFSFGFAPVDFAKCNGDLVQIASNQALYSLLGITYGGDGQTTFAYPELRGRTPISEGVGGGAFYPLGQSSGLDEVTLSLAEMGAHTHEVSASRSVGNRVIPANDRVLAAPDLGNLYREAQNLTGLSDNSVSKTGGSLPHPNVQPSLAVNFAICISGIYPSRN